MPQKGKINLDDLPNEPINLDAIPDAPSPQPIAQAPVQEEPSLWQRATEPLASPRHSFSEDTMLGKASNFTEDILRGMTSPLNISATVLSGGSSLAGKFGLGQAARILGMGAKVPMAGMVAEGGQSIAGGHPIVGGLEMLGGLAGLKAKLPQVAGKVPNLPVEDLRPTVKALPPGQIELGPPSGIKTTFNTKGQPVVRGADNKFRGPASAEIPFAGERGPIEQPNVFRAQVDLPVVEGKVIASEPAVDFQSQAHLGNVTDIKQPSAFQEAINLPRALKSSLDLSAPLRQGFGLIGRKEWWNNLGTQFKALRSEENFKAIQQSILDKPLFKPRMGLNGKTLPSYAEEAGLKLTDLTNLSSREEALMSTWAEKVPGVRASNRAYTVFLNKLRADTFESLVKDLDLSKDLSKSQEIASFINDATGRGKLPGGLEKHAQLLNSTFFSPRLIASRVSMYNRMLNPVAYAQASPVVRKEALRSLLSMTAAGSTVLGLAKMAGAEVSDDPNSADFGKAKIGNTRLDPWAGFQQYAVAASRLLQGKYTSSTSGKEHELGSGYGEMTRKDVAENFAANKLHPTWKFAYDILNSSDYRQFNIPEETVRLFVPMVAEDLYELWKEDPSLIPVLGPLSVSGMGVQTYSPREK